MLQLSILLSAFFLGLRSLFLALFEDKHWIRKIVDGFLCPLYLLIFVILFISVDHEYEGSLSLKISIFLSITILIGLSVFYRLSAKRKISVFLSLLKTCGFSCYILISFCLFSFAAMERFTEDRPIFKIILTGNSKKQTVEWKNPSSPLKKADLDFYEVKLESLKGEHLGTHYISGDQVAIRAKVIRFKPIFIKLGMCNLCMIDGIFNGYATPEKTNDYPTMGYSVPIKNSYLSFLWPYWEALFFQETTSIWIKGATLQSVYFPLVDKEGKPFEGSYFLTITEGGISSLPNFNR
jgi:hypothetical protein